MSATLAQLVNVRSQRAEALLGYLRKVEREWAKNPLLDRFGRSLDDVRIPLKVVPFEPVRHRAEAAETEHLRPPTPIRDDEEPAKKRYAGSRRDAPDDKAPVRPPQPLADIAPLLRHAVLLADPGGGKTEWLKNLARQQAHVSRVALEQHAIVADDVIVPVFLRLPELAKTLAEQKPETLHDFLVQRDCVSSSVVLSDAHLVAAAILWKLVQQSVLPESLVRFLWARWFPAAPHSVALAQRPLVCLDAYDEVRKGRETLAQYLTALAEQSACRIFLTSRIVGYSQPPPLPVKSVDTGDQRELRICPFEWNDTEKFVTDWFGQAERERGAKMIGELRTKYSVWGMASNPLMATLLCLDYSRSESPPFPLRRGAVYERVLWGLLGEWSKQRDEQALRALSEEEKKRCAAKLDLLAEVAYHFFLQGAERFSRTALETAMRNYLSSERGELFYAEEALRWSGSLTEGQHQQIKLHNESAQRKLAEKNVIATLCQELIEHDGLLALDSQDEKESWYGFLHLTFQEYLTACAMAQQANDEGWPTIEKLVSCKAWLPEWEETLILLTGKLKEPDLLLTMLSQAEPSQINTDGDDYFRHRLCLAARCLPELSIQRQPILSGVAETNHEKIQQTTKQIVGNVFNLWWKHRKRNHVFPHINRNLPAIAQDSLTTVFPMLLKHLNAPKDEVRFMVVEMLGQMGAVAAIEEVRTALVKISLDEEDQVRDTAAKALGQMGAAAATEEVLTNLVQSLYDGDEDERERAAWVLAMMGPPAASEDVLTALVETMLHDTNGIVRIVAACTLGQIGDAAEREKVLTSLGEALYDVDEAMQDLAAYALGLLGSVAATKEVLTALVETMMHGDAYYEARDTAIATLGQMGAAAATEEVLTVLTVALCNTDWEVRSSAAYVLGQMGSVAATKKVLTALIEASHDTVGGVRRNAVAALGQMGKANASEDVLAALVAVARHDEEVRVREKAAVALGQLSNVAATEETLTALVEVALDEEDWGCERAAVALGQLGSIEATKKVLRALVMALRNAHAYYAVRERAAVALGQMGAAAATEEVLTALGNAALNDAYNEVRRKAAKALGQMMTQGVRMFLKPGGKWEKKTVTELGQFVPDL